MRKKCRYIIFIILFISSASWLLLGQEQIFPLDQVKAGLKGKGRSVFIGDKIEEFDVEILGVMRNFQPKKNVILARLKGPALEKAGVIQGMSGSPVYIDNKLVGAVAYSIAAFPKDTLAGITPIEEMLSIVEEQPSKSTYSPSIPVRKYVSLEDLFDIHSHFFQASRQTFVDGRAFAPLSIPLVFNGFTSLVFDKTKFFFEKMGFYPIQAGSSGQTTENLSLPDLNLRGGDPVSVQLISGDFNMSAVGTVTYVDGNKVLAFGHPIYNLGAVDYAMTKARVLAVASSLSASFKIATVENLIGRFSQDRVSGAFGEIGKMPKLIPINIKMLNGDGETKEFKTKIVNDKFLTPLLVNSVVANTLSVEGRSIGDLSLELSGTIFLESGANIQLEDLFSGIFDASIMDLSNLVTSVVFFLTNNEFEDLGIHRIDLNIQAVEEVKFASLEKVWLEKYDVTPGERVPVKIYTRTFGGQSAVESGYIPIPHLPSGSEFQLIIGDAASLQRIEFSQYRQQTFVPRSLDQLIRILNNLRKNNRIYFKIIASKPGLFLKGEEMPNLPPTMKSMFSSPRAVSSVPTELEKSTLNYFQHPVPYVFRGTAIIPLKIK